MLCYTRYKQSLLKFKCLAQKAASTFAAVFVVLAICAHAPSAFASSKQEVPDDEVRALLKATLDKQHYFVDKFDAQVWMVDMHTRLERRAPKIPAHERLEILRLVHKTATEFGLNPQLVLSVIDVESRFDRYAISRAGARGLMQVMPFWRKEIGTEADNLFEMETNLRYGCAILKTYLAREKQALSPALARYNGSYGKGWYPNLVLDAFYKHWFLRELPKPTLVASAP